MRGLLLAAQDPDGVAEVLRAIVTSYGTHCEHVFAETMTGRVVKPWVNVLAAPDEGPGMTYGRAYRCVRCRRSHHLRFLKFHAPRPAYGLKPDWDE